MSGQVDPIVQLAADLEAAGARAMQSGANPSDVIAQLARFIGYSVANGSPCVERTNTGLLLAQRVMLLTASDVWAETRINQPPMGTA